jgi:putative Mn2+ efflux pump MntP
VSFSSILLLAIGLSMDATAVSAARGLALRRITPRHLLLVALFFGGFQALMPLLGWFLGTRVGPFIQAWDHWLVFVLLGAIGGKMLWEASRTQTEEDAEDGSRDPFAWKVLFVLAVATSVDAFAVGITLPLLNAPFLLCLTTIGVTTSVLSMIGLFAGRHFGALLGKRLDVAGGLVLMALGTKILIEHLTAR